MQVLAPGVWSLQHSFSANGLPISSRMTVVRLSGGGLWLHSPVPMTAQQHAELRALGEPQVLVAPNRFHHLFLADCARAYPQAQLWGAPGLAAKRPDLTQLRELVPGQTGPWSDDFDMLLFAGLPMANETVWWHKPTRTLILTDLLQHWAGALPWSARAWASLAGVRQHMAMPRHARWLLRDRAAARASAQAMLAWPAERLVVAHNSVLTEQVPQTLRRALEAALGPL